MEARPRQFGARRTMLVLWGLVSLLPAAAGCSIAGGGITICPSDHKLLDSAKCVAVCTDPYAAGPRELEKLPLEAYYVQPGDVLLLEIADLESDVRLPIDQTVLPDGTIDLAEYGRPVVAGMTVEQIEELVQSAVKASEPEAKVPQINVRLTVAESAVFYVLGEVNSPGAYPLIGRETVLDALMTAGGLSDRASNCGIILSRPTPSRSCQIVLPVCYRQIVQLADTTTNYQILPGDRIYVSTRSLCEQLMFWNRKCALCPPVCPFPCPISIAGSASPFATRQLSMEPADESGIMPAPAGEPEPAPATLLEPTIEQPRLAPPALDREISQ